MAIYFSERKSLLTKQVVQSVLDFEYVIFALPKHLRVYFAEDTLCLKLLKQEIFG